MIDLIKHSPKFSAPRTSAKSRRCCPPSRPSTISSPHLKKLSDIDLAAKTIEFKEKLAQGATLDDLLIEAFAVVREAGRRVLNMRHFDVQLIGGMVLHHGKIAEMKTGEGKTLVATLPVLPECARRQGRPRRHRQRLPGQARLRVDGPPLQVPRPDASASSSTTWTTRSARTPTAPTSPTAPTTSSASTTCATT